MRDEDLKNLPLSIEAWRVREMLEQLGFGPEWKNVRETRFLPREIQVDVYATTEKGLRYAVDDADGKPVAAMHHISIPYAGEWDKPADPVANGRVECAAISLWKAACLAADPQAEADGNAEWLEDWKDTLVEDEREDYRRQAREMLRWMGLDLA